MPRVPLDIPPGVIGDDTALAAAGAWWDADKVRFWRGRWQTIGGWESFEGTPTTGVCRNIFPWTDTASLLNVALGTHSNLEVVQDSVLYDITPAGLAVGNIDGIGGNGFGTGLFSTGTWSAPSTQTSYPRTWALSKYGQTLIANPRGGTIYQWSNNTAVVAAPVTNAPAKVMYALVTPQRQLLAFGCNEEISGTFNPLCIRGSDIEDITDWTTTSTNNAFETILEGGGQIVSARSVGDYLFVWTDSALYLGTFLGNPDQTYQFTRVGERCGLVGPNGVVVSNQTAFWVSPDLQFHQCSLGGAPSLVASPLQATMATYLSPSQQEKITLSTVSQFGEVLLFYPDSRDGNENSRYISVGLVSNASAAAEYSSAVSGAWSRGILARTAHVDAGTYQYPLAVDPSGNVYLHERGHTADGAAFSWYIESAAQCLGNGDQYLQVKGLWPDFQDQVGAVSVTVYTRKYPQDMDRVRGPYAISPGQSKRDFLASGRMLRLRFAGNSVPTYARMGKLELDMEATGLQ